MLRELRGLSEISKEKLHLLLENYNPWWSNPKWYEKDSNITEYRSGKYKLISRLYHHISKKITANGKYGIITIRGPRRSGKTTMIKLLIKNLMEDTDRGKPVSPKDIYYISLDYNELKVHDLFKMLQAIADQGEEEKYVFLDEASMYEDWASILKNVYDADIIVRGKLKIVATGSHSMDLAEAAEKLRGRQGELSSEFNLGGNLLFTPLRFVEVVEGLNENLNSLLNTRKGRKVGVRFEILKNLKEGTISDRIEKIYEEYSVTLNQLFENYLIHGGYPKAIKEFYENKQIDRNFYYDIAELLIKDSAKAKIKQTNTNLDPDVLKKILSVLVTPLRLGGALNASDFTEIAKGIKEKDIRDGYLQYLTSTWAIFLSYREKKNASCDPNYNEQPKLYVLDPLIFHALYAYLNNIPDPYEYSMELMKQPEMRGHFVESVIASHLILSQQLFEHVPHVEYEKVLMHGIISDGVTHEVDFILCFNKKNEPHRFVLESKYRENITSLHVPEGTIVLTKDILEADKNKKIVYIPTSLFLMLF